MPQLSVPKVFTRSWSLLEVTLAAGTLRFVLIGVARLQDWFSHVRYTDVDYQVYTDAAELVYLGDSPYARRTELLRHPETACRYPPLIAILVLPNVVGFPDWGKLLFSVCGLFAGCIFWRFLARLEDGGTRRDGVLVCSVALFLFNPFVFTLSTRGSCDSLGTLLLALFIDRLQEKQLWTSAAIYGRLVHIRLYPIIYVFPLLAYFTKGNDPCIGASTWCGRLSGFVQSGFVSGFVFLSLGLLSYKEYEADYVEQVFLYHIRDRIDAKHNFSIWFYPFWLFREQQATLHLFRQCSTTVQLVAILGLGLVPSKTVTDLARVFTLQTLAFVALNKVITAQYFLWFIQLLPLWLVPAVKDNAARNRVAVSAGLWLLAEVHWLFWAYWLEFGQLDWTRPIVWAASCVFFLANANLLRTLWGLRPVGEKVD